MFKIATASKQHRCMAEVNSISQKANVLSEKGEKYHTFVLAVVNKKACWVGSLKLAELEKSFLRLPFPLFIGWRRFIVCKTTGAALFLHPLTQENLLMEDLSEVL